MPIIKSAIKRVRQTIKRRDRNVALKRDIKTAVKAFNEKPSANTLSAAQSEIDTAVKKNLIHKRTAARRKAALARQARESGVKLGSSAGAKKTTAKKPAATEKTTTKTTKTAAKTTTTKKAPAKKPAAKKASPKKTA